MDSFEQMKAIAEQCSHFSPEASISNSIESPVSLNKTGIDCTMCRHYDNGLCKIKDEILVNMDQT